MTLVPVAAILVGSLRFHCVTGRLDASYHGPHYIDCRASFARGQELGYFEHGSTIVVLSGKGRLLADDVGEGLMIRMGERRYCESRSC